MQVSVRSRLRRAALLQPAIQAVARKILAAAGEPGAELSLDLVGDRRMRRLNREYRGRDLPTDVLAFPMRTPTLPLPRTTRCRRHSNASPGRVREGAQGSPLLGDIVISLHTAGRHAAADRRAVDDELGKL